MLVNGDMSDEMPVTSGVPQGSVPGPLLFLLYINKFPENIVSKVKLFADETAVNLIVKNISQQHILQEDLNRIQQSNIPGTWNLILPNAPYYTSLSQNTPTNPLTIFMVKH